MSTLQQILDKEAYQGFLHRLDARALLEHYGAQHCTEQANRDGTTEIVHSCLLDRVEPHHTNGDENPSAAVNLDKKTFVCYSLGFGCDLFHLVMKLEGKESLTDSMTMIGQFLTGATVDLKRFRDELETAFSRCGGAYTLSLPSYNEQILLPWHQCAHTYWDYRGISPEAVATLKLGYDERERRIVFPHFVDGTLVGWQKRAVPGETFPEYPKYRNSRGFPKSETLYNLDNARRYPKVCVVESPMSVARAVSLGVPNVVATFGAKVSEQQIRLLGQFETVYVWFDRDPAGFAGERKIVEGLYRSAQVFVVTPDGGRDLADAGAAEMAAKLNTAIPAALRMGQYGGRR